MSAGSRNALPQAVVASAVLHALALFIVASHLGTPAPARPPPVTVLATRLEAVPERAVVKPASPPEVLKNTLDPPQAKPLEDPITSRERRRIAERDQAAKSPKPKPDAPPPRPELPEPTARDAPLGRGLPAWTALDRLKDYLAAFFQRTWPLSKITGQIGNALVIYKGEVRDDLEIKPQVQGIRSRYT